MGLMLHSFKVITNYNYILSYVRVAETYLGSKSLKRDLWKETVIINELMSIGKRQAFV